MCAVGTLRVDSFGFPALMLKMAVFFLAAVWLVLDHVDSRGWDYPLIRVKYAALLGFTPVMLLSAAVQLTYFMGLRADVIASCCSTLFSGSGVVVLSNSLAALPHAVALALLAAVLLLTLAAGALVLRTESRPGKFGQGDKWISGLKAAKMPPIRRDHDETDPADAFTGLQGKSGFGRHQRREDACGACAGV
jgi:hypothetical protein